MAKHILPSTTPTPSAARRAVLLGGVSSAIGLVAGAAASAADLAQPDAELLALRPRLEAAVREVSASEMTDLPPGASEAAYRAHEAWISRTGKELEDTCSAIVDAPPAQTAEGRALKAAAAMYELRFAYLGDGSWPGSGEEFAWMVLSEIAGDTYVPVTLPEHLRASCNPGRA